MRLMIVLGDSDILTELTDQLADAMLLLQMARSRLPDSEQTLKEDIETTIDEIGVSRLKVLRLVLDAIINLVLDGEPNRVPSDFSPTDSP
jgi:hypothetical protein